MPTLPVAGLYVHVPFCKQACHYCDFHFSTLLKNIGPVVRAMLRELELRQDFLAKHRLQTIYYGGGTPSVLPLAELGHLIEIATSQRDATPDLEMTIETNPDDVTTQKLEGWLKLGFNRLSLGVQSFDNERLKFLNRVHDAQAALNSYKMARAAGFRNINLDLMFAIPDGKPQVLARDLDKIGELDPEHVSIYGLSLESNTVFGRWVKTGKFSEVPEEAAALAYEMIMERLDAMGYMQYEISNFCKPGFESRHNSAYWSGIPFLGIGPGAHSYDGENRYENPRNNAIYVKQLEAGKVPLQKQTLSREEQINDYILTSLRTSNGCDTRKLKKQFGLDLIKTQKKELAMLNPEWIVLDSNQFIKLTQRGKLLADEIACKLMV